MTLNIEDIPDFKQEPDWALMSRLTPAKWLGIRTRTTEVEAAAEQAMYVDLLLEIINLTTATQQAPTPAPPPPPDNLELALMKALAGKTWDCEQSSDLMLAVKDIMDLM